MPAGMLGGLGAGLGGAVGQLFGSSPTSQSTTGNTSGSSVGDTASTGSTSGGNGTSSGNNTSTTTPNLPGWYNNFLQSLVPQYQQQMSQAQTPLLGPQQQAQFQQGVNQNYNQQSQQLQSQLAKSGALDSGRAATQQTQLGLGKLGQINQYNASVPVQNATFSQQYGNQLLGQGMNFKASIRNNPRLGLITPSKITLGIQITTPRLTNRPSRITNPILGTPGRDCLVH